LTVILNLNLNLFIMSRILLFHPGALGDVLMTVPLCLQMRKLGFDLDFWGNPETGSLLRSRGIVDAWYDINAAETAALFAPETRWDVVVGERLRPYTWGIFLLQDTGGILAAKARAWKLPAVIYPSQGPAPEHQARYHLQKAVWFRVLPEGPGLYDLDKYALPSSGAASNIFAIQPGSGSPGKNWPLGHFLECAARLEEVFEPVFLLGPAEEDTAAWDAPLAEAGYKTLRLPLAEAGLFLSLAAGYLGNDSGITHLAALLGLPAWAVFRQDNLDQWKPLGPLVHIVNAAQNAYPDQVAAEIIREWKRSAWKRENRDTGHLGLR
jgi:ADP-heptose:LPS heptosyltransferase